MKKQEFMPLVSDEEDNLVLSDEEDKLEAGGPRPWRISKALLTVVLSALALAATAAAVRRTGSSPADSAGLADTVTLTRYQKINAANVGDCDCGWINDDDGSYNTTCAFACRGKNPQGPHTRITINRLQNLLRRRRAALPPVVNIARCQCDFIKTDDCEKTQQTDQDEKCVFACRGINPWGKCTAP